MEVMAGPMNNSGLNWAVSPTVDSFMNPCIQGIEVSKEAKVLWHGAIFAGFGVSDWLGIVRFSTIGQYQSTS